MRRAMLAVALVLLAGCGVDNVKTEMIDGRRCTVVRYKTPPRRIKALSCDDPTTTTVYPFPVPTSRP